MGRVRPIVNSSTSSAHGRPVTVGRGEIVTYQCYLQNVVGGMLSLTLILQSLNGIKDVQHDRAGSANINKGITSPHNKHLILHDSQGYEPGDKGKFDILEHFITEQTKKQSPAERLHAIWCAHRQRKSITSIHVILQVVHSCFLLWRARF